MSAEPPDHLRLDCHDATRLTAGVSGLSGHAFVSLRALDTDDLPVMTARLDLAKIDQLVDHLTKIKRHLTRTD